MSVDQFIKVPGELLTSLDESGAYVLLTSTDGLTVLRVDSSNVKEDEGVYWVKVGAPVEYVTGQKPVSANNFNRIETESFEVSDCTSNKKYCQNGVTLCCEPPHVITGTCQGTWTDC